MEAERGGRRSSERCVCLVGERSERGTAQERAALPAHGASRTSQQQKPCFSAICKTTTTASAAAAAAAATADRQGHADGGRGRHTGRAQGQADSRFGQLERRSGLALEHAVHKHAVLPVAGHKEVGRAVVDLQMAAGDK